MPSARCSRLLVFRWDLVFLGRGLLESHFLVLTGERGERELLDAAPRPVVVLLEQRLDREPPDTIEVDSARSARRHEIGRPDRELLGADRLVKSPEQQRWSGIQSLGAQPSSEHVLER